METQEWHFSRWRRLPLLIVTTLLFIASLAFALPDYSGIRSSDFVRGLAWFGVALFGFAFLFNIFRVLRTGLAARVSEEGLLAPFLSEQVIPWDQITRVSIVRIQSYEYVAIDVEPAFEGTFETSTFAKSLALDNRMRGEPAFMFTIEETAGKAADVVALIEKQILKNKSPWEGVE